MQERSKDFFLNICFKVYKSIVYYSVLTETNIEAEEVIAEPESKDEEEYDLPVPSKIRNGKRKHRTGHTYCQMVLMGHMSSTKKKNSQYNSPTLHTYTTLQYILRAFKLW